MKKVVISLGGSIVAPADVDYEFLSEFRRLVNKFLYKFIIVVGGGNTARKYIHALRQGGIENREQDLIGIEVTRLNAKLVALFLSLKQEIPLNVEKAVALSRNQRIVVLGGIKPGTTTDGVAAMVAQRVKADFFVNITNVQGLYDKNPIKNKNARLISNVSYEQLKKMLPKKEMPGQHFILDKLAAKIISEKKIKTFIVSKNLHNLENLLKGKMFIGTLIN